MLGIDKKESLLTLEILKSVEDLVTTADKKSIVLLTSEKSTAEVTVVVDPLVPPVILSVATKVPVGIVIAITVEDVILVIEAVAPLVPPVIVSATEKPELSPTTIVKVPAGYSAIPVARGIDVSTIVH